MGEPIPLVWVSAADYENSKAVDGVLKNLIPEDPVTTNKDGHTLYALPLPPTELPLKLPEVENYQPSGNGESPLATISDWLEIWFDLESGKSISHVKNLSRMGKIGYQRPEKPIQCRNGQDPVGTICVILILKIHILW